MHHLQVCVHFEASDQTAQAHLADGMPRPDTVTTQLSADPACASDAAPLTNEVLQEPHSQVSHLASSQMVASENPESAVGCQVFTATISSAAGDLVTLGEPTTPAMSSIIEPECGSLVKRVGEIVAGPAIYIDAEPVVAKR